MPGTPPAPSEQGPRKRQRTESSYPRRRSVTACNICRTRKSKCDNARPVCGFCSRVGATCVYEELRTDYSNYDSASLHIIDRLDNLERRIEDRFDESLAVTRLMRPQQQHLDPSNGESPASAKYPIVETLLEWPIFSTLDLQIGGRSLALMHDVALENAALSSEGQEPTPQMTEERFPMLPGDILSAVDRFLLNVHAKNPILDLESYEQAVASCSTRGFDNTVTSALIAITCALGLVATPYVPANDTNHEVLNPPNSGESRSIAECCMVRGRSILSAQRPSLLATQCHFFCGVYEMFVLRPVPAWLQFSQACLLLKLHIQARPFSTNTIDIAERSLVQRLYWSCMQSECELANELRVRSAGLEDLPFPYAFPKPQVDIESHPETHSREIKSWMYYLSETSLRRICNQVAWELYDRDPSSWVADIGSYQSHAEELSQKVEAWMKNLPHDLRIEEPVSKSTNELGLHVRSRFLMCRTWIFRPFLYFMVHAPQSALQHHRKDIEPLAYLCLEASIELINDATYHHRHHGTWYTVRCAFGAALALLAAAQVNSFSLPWGWQAAVQKAMQILRLWTAESLNLEGSLGILERLWVSIPVN